MRTVTAITATVIAIYFHAFSCAHLSRNLLRQMSTCLVSTSLLISPPAVCFADQSKSVWSEDSSVIAEVWRTVDSLYLDRTFNMIDWFKVRQDILTEDHRSNSVTKQSIKEMLLQLGDRYTRYLTPSEYAATLLSATGQVVGLGVELESTQTGRNSIIVRVEPGSSAEEAGMLAGDLVTNVDGISTDNLGPEEVAAHMR